MLSPQVFLIMSLTRQLTLRLSRPLRPQASATSSLGNTTNRLAVSGGEGGNDQREVYRRLPGPNECIASMIPSPTSSAKKSKSFSARHFSPQQNALKPHERRYFINCFVFIFCREAAGEKNAVTKTSSFSFRQS